MRIVIVLLIILNFIWLEAYLNIYSKYKSKCAECDELAKLSSKLRVLARLDQTLIRLQGDKLDSQSNELSTLRKQRSKIYRLRKDIKRKDRAIVRYKKQNEVFKNGYHESEKRCEDLRDKILTEKNVAWWYKNWYKVMQNEHDAYLYCLRQIQEEVTNAKEE